VAPLRVDPYDVAIVGAGLPGLRLAGVLAEVGLRVGVFERRTIAAESSALAAGHVPQRGYSRPVVDILRRTREIVDGLDRLTSGIVRFNVVGGLTVSRAPANRAILEAHWRELGSWGIESELLDGPDAARRWPEVRGDDLAVAHWTETDGFVRALDLTDALSGVARLHGAAIHEGVAVERIAIGDAGVDGLVVASGEVVTARRVVLAAGGWSRVLAEASGFTLPLRPFTLSVLTLLGVPVSLPFVSDLDAHLYAVQRAPDSVLVGLPPRLDVTPAAFPRSPLPNETAAALAAIRHRIPILDAAIPTGGWAGLLVSTPDGKALLGAHPSIDGLSLATGFGGGGVQWVGAVDAIADEIIGRAPFFDWHDFQATRFAGYRGEEFGFERDIPNFYDDSMTAVEG
jgi:glycine/D-amino acid oxidase-like deaminating enzyme